MVGRRARPPIALALPAFLGLLFLLLPIVSLLIKIPWSNLRGLIGGEAVLVPLRLSLESAAIATAVSLAVGVPIAWLLARGRLPGRSIIRALVTLPMVLPPVVGGIALLYAFGRNGLLGKPIYQATGYSFPFTTTAVVMAETFVSMPFLIVAVEGALRGLDESFEDAAATLGASRWFTFRHVTLPMITPAVAAGAVLCFARALGEFGATITFAGNFPGRTQTMPLAVYIAQQGNPDAALALSLVLLVVAVVILAALRDRWLRA